jgi:hypothetical protein
MSSRKSFFFFLFLKQRPRDGANLLAGNLKIAMLYIHKKSDCAMPSYVTYLLSYFKITLWNFRRADRIGRRKVTKTQKSSLDAMIDKETALPTLWTGAF